MSTQIHVEEEAHIAAIKKQTEYRERGMKVPSVTVLANRCMAMFMKDLPVE